MNDIGNQPYLKSPSLKSNFQLGAKGGAQAALLDGESFGINVFQMDMAGTKEEKAKRPNTASQ